VNSICIIFNLQYFSEMLTCQFIYSMEQNIFTNENIRSSLPDPVFKMCAEICNSPSDLKIRIWIFAYRIVFNVCLLDS
jgi:hypothetical protein